MMRRDAGAIREECQLAAGGDWDRWQGQTAPYRAAFKKRVYRLKLFENPPAPWLDARGEPLVGKGNFPLVERSPRDFTQYLYDADSLDGFRKDRAVVAVDRWLNARGIDLIFVPVPKMAQTYIEHFLDDTPPDGCEPPDDSGSPVFLVGNSFIPDFREQLVKEMNLLVHTDWRASATTEQFADLLREPGLLDSCRVLVWINTERHFTNFKPLPAPIAKLANVK